jgi:hypothetical protein
MCVIISGRASLMLPLVNDAMDSNPHGTGIAWVQKNGKLAYRKGITSPKRAKKILRAIGGGDAIFHARIASSGGQHALLSHPFRVERYSPVSYRGMDEEYLLFHNGISSLDWQSHVPVKSGLYWSDTRTIAHAIATGVCTPDDLKRDGGRWVLFYSEHGRAFISRIGNWQTHNLHPGLFFSNLSFLWDNEWVRNHKWWRDEKWTLTGGML